MGLSWRDHFLLSQRPEHLHRRRKSLICVCLSTLQSKLLSSCHPPQPSLIRVEPSPMYGRSPQKSILRTRTRPWSCGSTHSAHIVHLGPGPATKNALAWSMALTLFGAGRGPIRHAAWHGPYVMPMGHTSCRMCHTPVCIRQDALPTGHRT